MNSPTSNSISGLLLRAQQGDVEARERLGQWMLENVNRLVGSVLRQGKSSLGHSSLTSEVLVKLVRGETIDREIGRAHV